jgi:molybdopterin/thiamine biosynthesis adenylyltransferase
MGGSLCMVHTHPMSIGSVAFSQADDIGNVDTFRFFSRRLPGKANSCLVFDRTLKCAAGRVYTSASEWKRIEEIVVLGSEHRQVLTSCAGTKWGKMEEQFDRQALLLGAEGQRQLGQLRLGIIGGGGIGSLAAVVAAHSGVTDFVLVDFDVVAKTNLPRLIGVNPLDVGMLKTVLAERYIRAHRPDATVSCFQIPVEAPELLSILASLDMIICGTDDTTSRAYLNQLCHQYHVPVLDLGVQFAADPSTGKLTKEVGRANLMLPGSPCLSCTGQIDPEVLRAEGLPPEERARQAAEGYVAGVDVPEPSMMVFNLQVVGRGMQHLMAWVTGLPGISYAELFENFRFFGLTRDPGLQPVRKRHQSGCISCGPESRIAGAGDGQKMFVHPRPRHQGLV